MTSERCIEIIRDRLIALVDSGKLNATYRPSNSTISFYVKDISVGERPLLTLRLSNHRPTYQNYVNQHLVPPSSEDNTNVSVEFYKPLYSKDGKKIKDKVNHRVKVPQTINVVIPFVVKSFKYKPELLAKIFDISGIEVRFRPSEVGLRCAETAFQKSETPFLFNCVWEYMKINGL